MAKEHEVGGHSVGFLGLLTILFIALKLTHFIDWSWWWVLAPIWIPLGIVLAFMFVVIIVAVIADREK